MSIGQEFIIIHNNGNYGQESLVRIGAITTVEGFRHSTKACIKFDNNNHIITEESYDKVIELITDALARPQRLKIPG